MPIILCQKTLNITSPSMNCVMMFYIYLIYISQDVSRKLIEAIEEREFDYYYSVQNIIFQFDVVE